MKKQILVITALFTVYLVWGSTFFGIRVGLDGGFPPLLLIGTRFLLAGSLLYALARWSGEARGRWEDWRESAVLGFLLLVCGPGLVAWSEQWLSSSLAALLVSTSPVWVTLLDGKETFTPHRWLGVLLGLLGVAWLVGASMTLSGHNVLLGVAGCLVSALAWAVDHSGDESYQAVARLRLAALDVEAQAFDQALKTLEAPVPESFEPLVADRRGDVFMAQGKPDEAKTQYLNAWRAMGERTEYRRLVEVKLAALGVDVSSLAPTAR